MKPSVILCGLFLFIVTNKNFAQKLLNNEDAPKINITDWIKNIPLNKNLDNKDIVLDFWATWCGNCLKEQEHLNNLKEELKSEDIIFLSISNESKRKILPILNFIPFETTVVTDTTNITQINFGANRAIPLMVLINKNNKIKWVGTPKELDKKLIISLFKDNSNIIEKENKIHLNSDFPLKLISDDNILFNFQIKNSDSLSKKNSLFNLKKENLISLSNVDIKEILQASLNSYNNLIEVDKNILNKKFDFLFKNNYKNEINPYNLVIDYFNLKEELKTKKELVNIIKLKNLPPNDINLLDNEPQRIKNKSILYLLNYSIDMLCSELNRKTDVLYYPNKNYKNKYNFIIDITDENTIIESLEKIGFSVIKEYKTVKYEYFTINN